MIFRWIRRFILLGIVVASFMVVIYFGLKTERQRVLNQYDRLVTLAIETAVANALNNATRAAEVDQIQYRLITLGQDEPLEDVAVRYHTTVDALRMANSLLPDVTHGSGEQLIVPEGVDRLEPPRRLHVYIAVAGDTLSSLASNFDVPLDVLEMDNPILARRGLIPGDMVFVADIL